MNDVTQFYVHTATVTAYTGETATGSAYASPQTIPCFVDDARTLVVSGGGEQLQSQTTLYCDNAYAGLFTPDSKVTSPVFADGRTARVVKANSMTSGSLGLPDHAEISLM